MMKICRNHMHRGRLLFFSGLLIAAVLICSGCQENADSFTRLGDTYYGSGEKYKALEAYERALRLVPGDNRLKRKVEAVRSEIRHEAIKILTVTFLAVFLSVALSVLTVRYLTPEAAGKGFVYRLRLASGCLNWQEAEGLREDYLATRNFLVKRKIYSYLRPLSEILHEFFLMRDIQVASYERLNMLNRILQKDIAKLDEIAAETEDSAFASETRTATREYRTRVMQQKKKIMEFAEAFEQRRRLLHGFLIDLRTRLDLNEEFDGISEMNRLSQQIAAVRKTFMTLEKEWPV